jgi:hypothetical protein
LGIAFTSAFYRVTENDAAVQRQPAVRSNTLDEFIHGMLIRPAGLQRRETVKDGLHGLIKLRKSGAAEQMAQLARRRLRKKLDALVLALRDNVEAHHRFMLEMQLDRVEDIEANIAVVDRKIDEVI